MQLLENTSSEYSFSAIICIYVYYNLYRICITFEHPSSVTASASLECPFLYCRLLLCSLHNFIVVIIEDINSLRLITKGVSIIRIYRSSFLNCDRIN